jgi:phage FluMu protein Com
MDNTRCPKCKKRLIATTAAEGRTELHCLKCDNVDPLKTDAVKWATGPLAPPE